MSSFMVNRLNQRWAAARRGDDSGMALLSVLAVLFLLTGFLLVTMTFALGNLRPAKADQNAKAAQAAAQAGIDDFLARSVANSQYWRQAVPGNLDPTNPAFTTGAATGTTGATYTYKVVKAPNTGGTNVNLQSTGKVNGVTRSLTATIGPKDFLKYVYFSDKEDQDPLYNGSDSVKCGTQWWRGRSDAKCTEITFADGDTLKGDVHTNDTPLISGTVNFTQAFETSTLVGAAQTECSGATCYRDSGATFKGSRPSWAKVVTIPTSNAQLEKDATDDGCIYYGATQITFTGSTMQVTSPGTTTTNKSSCFNVANRNATQTVPVPRAIYIKDFSGICTNSLGFPRAGEDDSESKIRPDYDCHKGTAYVKGKVAGDVTLGTAQDIIVTGNLTYQNDPAVDPSSTDILGLIPTHTAWIYHPVKKTETKDRYGRVISTSYSNLLSPADAVTKVQAAILTVLDSFMVQDYSLGSAITGPSGSGNLTIYGSLAQNFRGTVGSTDSLGKHGYIKDYQYDPRFAGGYLAPTYFLQPVDAQWVVKKVSDG